VNDPDRWAQKGYGGPGGLTIAFDASFNLRDPLSCRKAKPSQPAVNRLQAFIGVVLWSAKTGEASHACFDTSDRAPAFREHDTGKCVVVQRGGSQLQGIGRGEPAWGSFELRSGTGFLHEDGDICRPVQRQDVEQLAEEIANRQPAFL
jgi:hypothetical protein